MTQPPKIIGFDEQGHVVTASEAFPVQTMRERLIKSVTALRNLDGSVNGYAEVIRILGTESAEQIVDAILAELRAPDDDLVSIGHGQGLGNIREAFTAMIDAVQHGAYDQNGKLWNDPLPMIDAVRSERPEPTYCPHGVMKPLHCGPCREEAERK
ncbi:hypothetical protein [Paraburkholderia fungorum]|uniref:hypothetical protein n=1 Tax=Paraburkholderia fungorum TaxID=134537 RepID=UPI003D6A6A44